MPDFIVVYTNNQPIVHASGCSHLAGDVRNAKGGIEQIAGTLHDVARRVYLDMLEPGESADDFLSSLTIKPCAWTVTHD